MLPSPHCILSGERKLADSDLPGKWPLTGGNLR